MRLLLIGYRGTGKTTVARLLAERLGMAWVDADDEIELRAKKTIAKIFSEEGETSFRDLEQTIVAELCQRKNCVIALGGGAILRPLNQTQIMSAGTTVWLTASVETLMSRIYHDKLTTDRRPNLTLTGGRKEIETVLSERLPIYRACATFEVSTEEKSPLEIANEIISKLA